ncbi:ABC transporter permease subunit [Paenibacillus sp. FSL H8-0537]|uniref:ABC transporter permease subunit n=1 Tax=Paenibacillus sp. FSL H8-0537 TaxID=2921399 RepID=UPI00310165F1
MRSVIWRYELRKALLSPVLLALLGLFIAFNLLLIVQQLHKRPDMTVLNAMAEQFGVQITDQMQAKLERYDQQQLAEMNALTKERAGKIYAQADDFFIYDNFNEVVYEQPGLFLEQEIARFHRLSLVQHYAARMQSIDEAYAKLDTSQLAKGQIQLHGLSGQAAEVLKERYAGLDTRLQQLEASGEHKHLFFDGQVYGTHSMLFKSLFRTLLFELMIIAVLLSVFLSKNEFEQHTHLLFYSSKHGRKLQTDKLLAALASTAVFTTIVVGITLSVYFLTFSYKGLWEVPISSFFTWEPGMIFPFLTWRNLTFGEYFGCAVALMYGLQLIFAALAFVLGSFIRSSYLVYGSFAVLFGSLLLLGRVVPASSELLFYASFTPFHLMLNPHIWFTAGGAFNMIRDWEWMTAGGWAVVLTVLCYTCLKQFKRQNIH